MIFGDPLSLYKRIGWYLYNMGWTDPDARDIQSDIFLTMLESDRYLSIRFTYLEALVRLTPKQELEAVRDNIDKLLTYTHNYTDSIDVETLLNRIPKKDRICILKFMHDLDTSTHRGSDMRRKRILETLREELREEGYVIP